MTRILHRQTGHSYPVAASAEGVTIRDGAGKEYIDASAGAAVSCLGHSHPDVLAAMHAQLDQLAYGIATSVNTAHRAGYDLNGSAGGDFFTPPALATGAASALTVSAAVRANGSLIAAAGVPAAGDNQNARAITNLQRTALAGGTTTPIETWGALVYRVGSDSQRATNEKGGHDDIVKQLQSLRDQISGVSLGEEAANLMRFQRAYEANARYFSAIQTSLDVLMAMVAV